MMLDPTLRLVVEYRGKNLEKVVRVIRYDLLKYFIKPKTRSGTGMQLEMDEKFLDFNSSSRRILIRFFGSRNEVYVRDHDFAERFRLRDELLKIYTNSDFLLTDAIE